MNKMGIFNNIRNFFKRIGVGINRATGSSLPFTPPEKKVGNYSEVEVYNALRAKLPEATIIRNICLDSDTAKGDIDLLIIYEQKVFILELKSWRGSIYQEGDNFFQNKDSSSGINYTNERVNPFSQIKRNLFQIKQQFSNIWFTPVILFIKTDSVDINQDIPWFTDIEELLTYIDTVQVRTNQESDISAIIKKVQSYDKLVSSTWFGKELSCIINENSLRFYLNQQEISKKDILSIKVKHHFSYDDAFITLKNTQEIKIRLENHKITYKENGKMKVVSLSKIDVIFVNKK